LLEGVVFAARATTHLLNKDSKDEKIPTFEKTTPIYYIKMMTNSTKKGFVKLCGKI
jgi:hypothetical protein